MREEDGTTPAVLVFLALLEVRLGPPFLNNFQVGLSAKAT
jgi:hypothetical protein